MKVERSAVTGPLLQREPFNGEPYAHHELATPRM